MPTPASGAISMNDMRVNISRATGSSISMSEMRERYGGSGAISFNDLRNCEGFTISPVNYTVTNKFLTTNLDGWNAGGATAAFGSMSPTEVGNTLQYAANSYMRAMYEDNTFTAGNTSIFLSQTSNTSDLTDTNGNTITAGYKGTNVTRIVVANTARSISASTNTSTTFVYNMPTSGTLHCLVKF